MNESIDGTYDFQQTELSDCDIGVDITSKEEIFIPEDRTNNGETELYDVGDKVILRQYVLRK